MSSLVSGKLLKTLDLRNMFIDTSDCEEMPSMISLTCRCVKVTGGALQDVNYVMPKLQTLALLGVFGVERGNLKFQEMKVLCLGLSTPAKDIVMHLPKLEKLQLKMQCPQSLIIKAHNLKYVAFNLEVLEPSKLELGCMAGLQELLYGASSFLTLSSFVARNPRLKIFLDIPCMALGEDGRFLGVLKDVPLMLPNFSKLHECGALEVLNIGPGLWNGMETIALNYPCAQQALDLPCTALLRDGRYLDMLDDIPVFIPSFSKLHECNNPGVSNSPLGRVRYQWRWETPDGLNLRMSESGAQ